MATEQTINSVSKQTRTMCRLSGVSLGRIALAAVAFMCIIQVTLTDKYVEEMQLQSSEPLSLLWGIGDATAYVGKLFTYPLPSDAFQGNVVHYDITEVGKDRLPSWISFNALKAELKGIPGQQHKGRVYLEVKATGDDNSQADDVFSIEVLEDTYGSIASSPSYTEIGPKSVSCERDKPQTIVTVIVDCDFDAMLPSSKIGLLDNMVSHLNLAPETLKMMPVGEKPMFDSSALVAGPGNVRKPRHAGTLVSWLVGCGKVEKDHMPILQLIETSASNGDMSGALGHGIIGWHVTNSRFQEKVRRKRAVTATPTLTVPPPTSISESTTDDMTKPAMQSTSTYIAPTQTIDIQPTKVVTSSSSSSSASSTTSSSSAEAIEPTETMKMTKTKEPDMSTTSTKPVMTSSAIPSTTTATTTTTTTTVRSTTTTMKPKPTTVKPKMTTPEPECPPGGRLPKKAPKVKNPVRNITIESGVIKKIRIPENTFFDCYDDATSDLTLRIEESDGGKLPSDFWLKIIHRPARPYNILMNPLNTDAGSYTFKLTATNFYEMSTSQDISVIVLGEEMNESPPTHELSMSIDTDYDKFMSDIEDRVELSNKVAGLYGDKNSKFLTVTKLERGSVVYAWTNNSLSGSGCPVDALNDVVGKLVDENGNLTPEVQDAMQPYTINSIASAPLGSCTNNPNFPARTARRVPLPTPKPTKKTTKKPAMTTPGPNGTVKYTEKTTSKMEATTTAPVAQAGTGGGSDMWITTVVPAIVVVVVLIIALVIACCLYRKKRQGRMKLQEKDSFAQNKGVPVIFADEYEEKPNDSTRPLIMEEEKPPMPPPEYPRASSETSGNSNSTQPIEDKDVEEIEMEDTDITSPLYSPPPPVTASNNSKPPHVQSSRGPPPYVPP